MRGSAIGRPPGSQIAALILMFSSCAFARVPRRMRLASSKVRPIDYSSAWDVDVPPPGDYSAARHRAPLPCSAQRAARAREESDIDLFFEYKRQKSVCLIWWT